MGNFTLACLLGQNDRAQSFDVASYSPVTNVQSWEKQAQSNWSFTGSQGQTYVHSSPQALQIEVNSLGGASYVLRFRHGRANDAFERWFPEVDTHTIESAAWILVDPVTASGDLNFELRAASDAALPLPGSKLGTDPLGFHQLNVVTYSDGSVNPDVGIWVASGPAVTSGTTVIVDDVLTSADRISLFPEWTFQERARLIRNQHRALGGELHTHVWDKYFAYTVPLRFLPDSHVELINWWWQSQFDLLFTLNSSDSESRYIVRIVNDVQPVGRRVRPYDDLWEGTLQLESINRGDLVF